jgi:hypothetical protein
MIIGTCTCNEGYGGNYTKDGCKKAEFSPIMGECLFGILLNH